MNTAPRNHAFVLTPRAAGAIAVIRLIGPDSPSVADRLLRTVSGRSVMDTPAGRLGYAHLVDRDEVIDDVIFSRAPSGDTSAIDICTHGGPRVVQRLTQALETVGVPVLPEPQLETRLWPARNQIEADADRALLGAKTQRAVRFLAWQRRRLGGELERCAKLCVADPHQARDRLSAMAQRERGATSLITGASVTIIGPPNSGKSTLFNRLVGRVCVLVSDMPGTTRDWVRQSVEMNGVPLELVDTAGARETSDALERLAIKLGRHVATRSEVRLLVVDASTRVSGPTHEWIERSRSDSDTRVIWNKSDRGMSPDNTARASAPHGTAAPLVVSAATGTGIESVIEAIMELLGVTEDLDRAPALFCTRQTRLLSDILEALSVRPRRAATLIRNNLIGPAVDSVRAG